MARDAFERNESCEAFREESQTEENEALRDENYCHVSAWEHKEKDQKPELHKELVFENVKLTQRSYK